MQKNYKLAVLFLILLFVCVLSSAKEVKKNMTFILNYHKDTSKDIILKGEYLIDIAEMELLTNHEDVSLKNINGEIDSLNLTSVKEYSRSSGIYAFYYIKITDKDNSTDIGLYLYNSAGENIYDCNFMLDSTAYDVNNVIGEKFKKKWLESINESYNVLDTSKQKISVKNRFKNKISFEHDFPIFNIALTGISGKLYFDERVSIYPHKMFSFFPLQARATFFPLKYFEAGVFFKIIYDNMVYKYEDLNNNRKKDFFDSGLVFYYGFFAGLSFFNETSHYSIGIEFYNLYYDLSKHPEWNKVSDYRSYFLPQFSLYQKIDFKLFKFLYYSLQLNFRTIPQFQLADSYMRSYPFLFDFFIIEISVVGLSIMF